jgi:hypothetical protein
MSKMEIWRQIEILAPIFGILHHFKLDLGHFYQI